MIKSDTRPELGDARTELVIAHPGHELRLFTLLQALKPRVWILTTGAKQASDRRRIDAAADTVLHCGAHQGSVFGAVLDATAYSEILAGRTGLFEHWADQLRDAFVARAPARVIVDGWQLYSPVHDLAHLLGRVAAAEAGRVLGCAIDCLQFQVVSADAAPLYPRWPAVHAVHLSDTTLADKVAAARLYPGLDQELAEAMSDDCAEMRVEALCPPPPLHALAPPEGRRATYEHIAEERVARGVYAEALRWRHFDVVRTALLRRIALVREELTAEV